MSEIWDLFNEIRDEVPRLKQRDPAPAALFAPQHQSGGALGVLEALLAKKSASST